MSRSTISNAVPPDIEGQMKDQTARNLIHAIFSGKPRPMDPLTVELLTEALDKYVASCPVPVEVWRNP
jgi:hypothetical protein